MTNEPASTSPAASRAPDAILPAGKAEATRPRLARPASVIGNKLVFRDARIDDAGFIVALRTHATKSAHISKTSSDVRAQRSWLEGYAQDREQIYFVIEDKLGERVGTVRLYDVRGRSFCWGSWILKEGAPSTHSIESALLVYHFALGLGFDSAHFEVRKANDSVWKFHERFGAERIAETDEDYRYTIPPEAIRSSLDKYRKFLPDGVTVT